MNKNIEKIEILKRLYLSARIVPFYIALFLVSFAASGVGLVPVRNFLRNDYKGGSQNWAMVQDSIGRVYIGNRDGVLVYDGLRWKPYYLGNYTTVRSLNFEGETGRIYAGGTEEFGYFESDPLSGQLRYKSLMPLFGKSYPTFTEIWNIMTVNGSVWFQADFLLFGYDGTRLRTFPAAGRIARSAVIDGTVVLALEDGRIQYLKEGGLRIAPNTERLSGKKTAAILPSPLKGSCLIVTSEDGIYLYDGKEARPYETGVNEFLKENQVFSAASRGDCYVFGTIERGAVVQNLKTGSTKYVNKDNGMQNNTVLGIGFDHGDNIWLCLDNGLDYVIYNSPITYLTGASNDIGAGYASLRLGNDLYLGTNQGLYSTSYPFPEGPNPISVKRELLGQVWALSSDGDNLIVSGDRGLFEGRKGNFTQIPDVGGTYKFEKLPGSSTLALASTYDRFHLLRKTAGQWRDLGPISGFDDKGGDFRIDRLGYIWLPHFRKGIYRLHLDTASLKFDDMKLYDSDLGLPDNHNNSVEIFEGEPVIATTHGYYHYDRKSGRMVPFTELQKKLHAANGSKPVNLTDGLVILMKDGLSVAKRRGDGTYNTDSTSFVSRQNQLIPGFENLNYLSPKELIVSNQEGFWNVNTEFQSGAHSEVSPFVETIYANRDSVVYRAPVVRSAQHELVLTYDLNSLLFEFGYPDFTATESVEFSSYLEGYDEEWTPYSTEPKREYTRLGEGEYVMHVRARDMRTGRISETDYEFKITPPWYRSTVAKIIYGILIIVGGILVYLLLHHYVRKAQRKVEKRKEVELEKLRRDSERDALQKDYEIATLKSDQLEKDMRQKSSELSNTAMNLIHKNEVLADIGSKLTKLQTSLGDSEDHIKINRQLAKIKASISDSISHDDDLDRFTENFDIVYVDFTKRLSELHPGLSQADRRLCCYIKMGLSSKEIAPLINISYKSVEMARYRLRKKMGLGAESSLTEYLGRM